MSVLTDLFGSKPTVPNMPQISLGQMQQAATQSNISALPGAENLVSKSNQFSQDQIAKMLENAIPGYSGMMAEQGSDLSSMIRGQIPTDVSNAIQNSAAGKSLGEGIAGSGAARDLVARDLGLTSLNLMETGMATADKWVGEMASIEQPSMMKVESMFVSPEQQYQATNEQNVQQFQRNWMQSQVSAMPDPVASGIMNMAQSAIGSMRGGSGDGGTQPQSYAGIGGMGGDGGFGASTDLSGLNFTPVGAGMGDMGIFGGFGM